MSEQTRDVGPSATDDGHQSDTGTVTCAVCETTIDEYEWHPIRGRRSEDEDFTLHSFCSDECVRVWEER